MKNTGPLTLALFLPLWLLAQNPYAYNVLHAWEPCENLLEEVRPHSKDSLSAQTCIYSGVCLMQRAEYQSALSYLDQAIRLDRDLAAGYYYKAEVLFRMNRMKEALIQYDNAIYLQPRSPDFIVGKGYSLFLAGRHDEAISCFLQALELPACPEQAQVLLGRAYQENGQMEQALNTYSAGADQLTPGSPAFMECMHRYGLAQYLDGDFAEAKVTFSRILAMAPDDYEALIRLVQVHFAREEYAQGHARKMELYSAFHRGLLPPEWVEKGFCFDQFEWEDKRIYAYERLQEPGGFEAKHLFYVTDQQGRVLEKIQTEHRPEAALKGKKYVLAHWKGDACVLFEEEAFDENFDYSVLKKSVIRILKSKDRPGIWGVRK